MKNMYGISESQNKSVMTECKLMYIYLNDLNTP